MSLAVIQYPPPLDGGIEEWLFAHVQHHQAIVDSLKDTKGINLDMLLLWPLDVKNANQLAVWNRKHQTMHTQMTAAVGVAGEDISTLDPSDRKKMDEFFFTHFTQHRDVAQLSGLPI